MNQHTKHLASIKHYLSFGSDDGNLTAALQYVVGLDKKTESESDHIEYLKNLVNFSVGTGTHDERVEYAVALDYLITRVESGVYEMNRLREHVDGGRGEFNRLVNELAMCKRRCEYLNTECDAKTEKLFASWDRADELRLELTRTTTELGHARRALHKQRRSEADLDAVKVQLQSSRDEANRLREYQHKYEAALERIGVLMNHKELKLEIDGRDSDILELQDELRVAKDRNLELERVLKFRDNDIGVLTDRLRDFKCQCEEFEMEVEGRGHDICDLRNELREANEKIAELTKRCRDMVLAVVGDTASDTSDADE